MKKTPALAAAALAAGVALFFFLARRGGEKDAAIVRLVSEVVSRGDVVSTVAASGTIEPDELVDVGSQVTGEIVAFGTDASGAEVDYCSIVTNGMVLARIDDVTYLADLDVAARPKSTPRTPPRTSRAPGPSASASRFRKATGTRAKPPRKAPKRRSASRRPR